MAAAANPSGDTIFALSSGAPPAAIAIVRISGPDAGPILEALTARACPEPRKAVRRALRDRAGEALDDALILWFPGPRTATGEDLAELHLHGGRAVVDGVRRDLADRGLREAEPGEFTRRAFLHGRLSFSEVEGLADLLSAETEWQRREALARSTGALARKLMNWQAELLLLAARLETAIDYDGEEEADTAGGIEDELAKLAAAIENTLLQPPAERLRDGLRVAIIGPPNSGKSTLFNAILGQDAAIVSPIAGTTRDVIERPVAIGGIPFLLIDTAGLRETLDPIERIGVERAHYQGRVADIVLALDGSEFVDAGVVLPIATMIDLHPAEADRLGVSAVTGEGVALLLERIVESARALLPPPGESTLDRRYRAALGEIHRSLRKASDALDPILQAEHLRVALREMDRITGQAGIEDLLDTLFGRFCLGK